MVNIDKKCYNIRYYLDYGYLTNNRITELELVNDTRQQRRIPLQAKARVYKIGNPEKTEVVLLDVSNFGASFKGPIILKPKDRIMLSISINHEDEVMESEEVAASVRWVERAEKDYLAGVKLDIKISDAGFPLFNRCLEYLKTHE